MKKLNVPLIQQREGSYHCQVATLLMVMDYFNDGMEYDVLLSDLKPYLTETGMHNQGAAIYLRKRGYQTFFAHHDLDVLSPDIEDITEKDLSLLEKALEETPDDEKSEYRKTKLKLDIEYIKLDGQYSTKLPSLSDIDAYLEKDIPIILGAVLNKGLHLKPYAGQGNHAIVITGKDRDQYFVNDPSPKTKGQYAISSDRLLHALYRSGVHMRAAWN